METLSVRIPGKLVLFGEYAVTQGYSGVAIPVPLFFVGVARRAQGKGRLKALQMEPGGNARELAESEIGIDVSKTGFFSHLRGLLPGFSGWDLELADEFFPALGLGASSASFLAVFLLKEKITQGIPFEDRSNERFLRLFGQYREAFPRSSGIDIATQFFGKPVRYRLEGRSGDACGKPVVETADWQGVPGRFFSSSTKAVTQGALRLFEQTLRARPQQVQQALQVLGNCADRFWEFMQQRQQKRGFSMVEHWIRESSAQLEGILPEMSGFWNQLNRLRASLGEGIAVKSLGAAGGDVIWALGPENRLPEEINDYYRIRL